MIDGQQVFQNNLCVNKFRIESELRKLSMIGMNSKHGIDRPFGSKSDIVARKWLRQLWESTFLSKVEIDAVANMWIGIRGKEALSPIVLGSHHDSVTNGGMYDGAVGVILATEIMRRISENVGQLRHPIRIVSFSAEEPNPYNVSTLGSRAITGKLSRDDLEFVSHIDTKEKLKDTIKYLGGNIDHLEGKLLQSKDMAVFLECHIEQGRRLFDQQLSLAVVTHITGIYREKIKIIGEANHAGTTMMSYRRDALLAGSELSLALERIVNEIGQDDVVGTIGYFSVTPNSANIISGEIELIAEVRTSDETVLRKMLSRFEESIKSIEEKRNIRILRDKILDQKPVPMDQKIQEALKKAMTSMKEPFLEIPSMAGHDSVHMASIAKTGMIFVPSIDGKSHCPEEKTNIEDIEKAGNVLLQTVFNLDKELD